MKKAVILLVVIILFALGYLIIFTPSLVAPTRKSTLNIPKGADLSFPLSVPEGFMLGVYADLKGGLPRVLALDPQGVLVASIPNQGKIVALPDENKDGVADRSVELVATLNKPHGIAFEGQHIYIAETNKVTRYLYDPKNFSVTEAKKLFDLPVDGRHSTRTIRIHDGKLYTSVGSSCDVCNEKDNLRASLLISDLDGKNLRVFAKGLRNSVFFTFDSRGRIWGNDMGRDFLGDNLPPDELNIIEESPSTSLRTKDYGWPYCYGKNVHDSTFDKRLFKVAVDANICEGLGMTPSLFDYPAHVAPLGITFINSDLFPKDQGDLLVSFHGSWNSTSPVGYKIVKLDVENGQVTQMEDFITEWIKGREVLGRPVDLIFDKNGVLYISDDKGGFIYRLTK